MDVADFKEDENWENKEDTKIGVKHYEKEVERRNKKIFKLTLHEIKDLDVLQEDL